MTSTFGEVSCILPCFVVFGNQSSENFNSPIRFYHGLVHRWCCKCIWDTISGFSGPYAFCQGWWAVASSSWCSWEAPGHPQISWQTCGSHPRPWQEPSSCCLTLLDLVLQVAHELSSPPLVPPITARPRLGSPQPPQWSSSTVPRDMLMMLQILPTGEVASRFADNGPPPLPP